MRSVAVQRLVGDVGIKFGQGDDGMWRFVGWDRPTGPVAFLPNDADRARVFATVREAVDYFRAEYGVKLGGGKR